MKPKQVTLIAIALIGAATYILWPNEPALLPVKETLAAKNARVTEPFRTEVEFTRSNDLPELDLRDKVGYARPYKLWQKLNTEQREALEDYLLYPIDEETWTDESHEEFLELEFAASKAIGESNWIEYLKWVGDLVGERSKSWQVFQMDEKMFFSDNQLPEIAQQPSEIIYIEINEY